MKKAMLIFCSIMIMTMVSSLGFTEDLNPAKDISNEAVSKEMGITGKDCGKVQLDRAALKNVHPELPFLLQGDQKECLDKCSQEFDACMSGVGDSADAEFRCGEKRWACTLNCDDVNAPQVDL